MNRTNRPTCELSRRQMLRLAAAGVVGFSTSGWIEALAADAAAHPTRRKSCILLWMTGGPSQIDTFDPKPGHANGGPFKAIETACPASRISEHLPKLARQMKDIAIIRSMSTKEGDHGRATFHLRTGYLPTGPDPLPDPRLARRQGARARRGRAAQLRQHRAGPLPSTRPPSAPASSARSTPRWSSASARVLDAQGGTDARNLSLKVEDLSLPPGVDTDAGRRPARPAGLVAARTSCPAIPASAR